MNCAKCGALLIGSKKFCAACGALAVTPPPTMPEAKRDGSPPEGQVRAVPPSSGPLPDPLASTVTPATRRSASPAPPTPRPPVSLGATLKSASSPVLPVAAPVTPPPVFSAPAPVTPLPPAPVNLPTPPIPSPSPLAPAAAVSSGGGYAVNPQGYGPARGSGYGPPPPIAQQPMAQQPISPGPISPGYANAGYAPQSPFPGAFGSPYAGQPTYPFPTLGARVLVLWADGNRYPGVVQQMAPGQSLVVFIDGQQRWVDNQYLLPGA